MLYTVDKQRITHIPHRNDYDRWRSRLSDEHYTAIMEEFRKVLDKGEVQVSSFIPGSDWTDTVYQPIYEEACDEDDRLAAFFFGLLMWNAVMEHPEAWSFQKYSRAVPTAADIQGMVYFRITLPGDPAELR
jgi:hypothetical protein